MCVEEGWYYFGGWCFDSCSLLYLMYCVIVRCLLSLFEREFGAGTGYKSNEFVFGAFTRICLSVSLQLQVPRVVAMKETGEIFR